MGTPSLPADFTERLAAAFRDGIRDAPAESVRQRALSAIDAIGLALGRRARQRPPAPWAADMLAELELAIHAEICSARGTGLKPEYQALLDGLLTEEGIARLTAIVLELARAIDPALAVSSVGLYVAVWLLKVGLNRWCAVGRRGKGAGSLE